MTALTRQTLFQEAWIQQLNAQSWLRQGDGPTFAYCIPCNANLSVAQSGIGALKQHVIDKKHISAVDRASKSHSIDQFFKPEDSTARSSKDKEADNVLKAESLWSLHLCETNTPPNSQDHAGALFPKMFSDSQIAQKITCGRTKLSYLQNFALDPYLHSQLVETLQSTPFSLACDEGDGRLAVLVRFVESTDDDFVPQVRLLDNVLLTTFTAEGIANTIKSCLESSEIPLSNCLQIMSDNCSVMRGKNGGVLVHLKEHGLPHLADSGGCVLHIVANAQKLASADFESSAQLCDDIHSFFHRSHTRPKQFRRAQVQSGVPQHALLRRVETRWLQQLAVFERTLEQYPALNLYFSDEVISKLKHGKEKAVSIAEKLKKSSTKIDLSFLAHALKVTDIFERRFQSNSALISMLFDCMLDLLQAVLLQFIKPEVVQSALASGKLWEIDLSRLNQVDDSQLGLGEGTRILLRDTSRKASHNSMFLLKVRAFYSNLAGYLAKELPFRKLILRRVRILNPAILNTEDSVDLAIALAKQLPTVVKTEELDALRDEVLELRLQAPPRNTVLQSLTVFWHQVADQKNIFGEPSFPVLTKMAQAVLTFFHGNADPERAIGKSHDIDDDSKRNAMSEEVRLSNLRIRSFLASTKLLCHDFEVTRRLLDLGYDARAKYTTHQAEKKKLKAAEAAKQASQLEESRLAEAAAKSRKLLEKETQLREREKAAQELEDEAERKFAEAEAALQKVSDRLKQAQAQREAAQKAKQAVTRDRHLVEQQAFNLAVKRHSKNPTDTTVSTADCSKMPRTDNQ